MRMTRPRKVLESDGRVTLLHPVTVQDREFELFLRVPGEPVYEGVEPFIALTLLPAMRLGTDIVVETPVSPKFLKGIEKIQEQLHAWFPQELKKVRVEAEPMRSPPAPIETGKSGCLFSGGVDSFYSILTHREELSGLIFGHGLDIQLDRFDLRERVQQQLRHAAEDIRLPLVEVETNARHLFDATVDWGKHYHGSVLAGVALVLSRRFASMIIPSGRTPDMLFPWGSHPEVDPLWSTEWFAIIHDSIETSRSEKIMFIAGAEVAQKHLRVCYHNVSGKLNCGRCEKCLRTMVVLRAAGVLDRCTNFETELDLKRVASLPLLSRNIEVWYEDILKTVRKNDNDLELKQALEDCLNRKFDRGVLRLLRRIWWRLKRYKYRNRNLFYPISLAEIEARSKQAGVITSSAS